MTMTATVERGERAEIAAWTSVWEAAPDELREQLGLSLERRGLATAFGAAAVPMWLMNRVVGLGLDELADREWLDARLDQLGGVGHGVTLCAEARPADIADWLAERGLEQTTVLAKMMRRAVDLPAPRADVTIRLVGREQVDGFAEAMLSGFGLPQAIGAWFGEIIGREGWRAYVALHAGEPIGTGALFVRGDVGWLGFGSTVPGHRNRGVHEAMMARRMRDAADLGCRWLVTETNLPVADEPTPSLDNMRRLGFELAYERPNWVA